MNDYLDTQVNPSSTIQSTTPVREFAPYREFFFSLRFTLCEPLGRFFNTLFRIRTYNLFFKFNGQVNDVDSVDDVFQVRGFLRTRSRTCCMHDL